MAASVKLVVALFTALLAQECQGACPAGWFGRGCKSKCRCRNSTTCDVWEGTCPGNGPCQHGFFGPGCQQLDRCNRSYGFEPAYLKDCDDSTCNPDVNATSVVIEYRQYDTISFFRIVVNDPEYLRRFTFVANDPCQMPRLYNVSDTTIDLVCTGSGLHNKITITGPTVGRLCSIHVAIGRNVALKQRTWQSSNSSNHPEWGLSSNAIDDNIRDIYDNKSSCSQTGVQSEPQWIIEFDHPIVMLNTEVYNRNIYREKLLELAAHLWYNTSNWGVSYFQRATQPVRRQGESVPNPTTKMVLKIPNHSELTLCEVRTLGEFWCLDGMWGLNCDKQCICGENQSCSIHTGACSEPCPFGKYGLKCVKFCSNKCVNRCTERWGLCKCRPGETGNECLPDCPPGTYGRTCQFNCSSHCIGNCSYMNGACQCEHGWLGPHCTECLGAKYGGQCELSCSHYCLNKCNSTDGSCMCKYNRVGKDCADCPEGRYGDNCSSLCPLNCGGNRCNIVGNCDVCEDGFYGSECDKNCTPACANNTCDIVKGRCFSCLGNVIGQHCEACPPTYTGVFCYQRCSPFCLDRMCEMLTQKCHGCIEGYIGTFCDKEEQQTLSYYATILLLLPLVILIFLCCLVKRKATIPEKEEEEEEGSDEESEKETEDDD